MQGRVMSLYQVLIGGTTPIGATLVGFLAQRFNVPFAVMLMAMLCGSGVGLALLYTRRNHPRMTPDDQLLTPAIVLAGEPVASAAISTPALPAR
jgi:uncharacterized membrane protein YdcZ (DUF606 family)